MKRPLGTSAKSISEACLLLVDLLTQDGIQGRAYAFCYQPAIARSLVPIVAELSEQLVGSPLLPVDLAHAVARHFRLPGLTGPLAMVASSVDTAVWDALAKSAGKPLAVYLGASRQPIPAYNTNGLGLMPSEAAADEAEALLADGFTAVKLRLGRSNFVLDLAAVRAVRRRVQDSVRLMVDFNQALTFSDAMQYALALDHEGFTGSRNRSGMPTNRQMAQIARTPIRIGESFTGLAPMAAALEAGSSDYVMLDLDRIGGVTGRLRASGLASAYNREVSSHLFPEVSARLLAATPGRHWLEYVGWADLILQEPLPIKDGLAMPSSSPGNGLAWNDGVVAKYRLT